MAAVNVTSLVSLTPARSAFKFVTRVVLVTDNGDVPVATVETTRLAVTLPETDTELPVALPRSGVSSIGVLFNTTVSPVPVRLAKLIICPVTTTGLVPV